jgi:hypothetical protein
VNVLRHMLDAAKTGGLVLDLQVIRPNPRMEVGGRFICELDGEPLFAKADAAAAVVDAAIAAGQVIEEAVDDHDVLKHYADGADLVDDWKRSERQPLGKTMTELRTSRDRVALGSAAASGASE